MYMTMKCMIFYSNYSMVSTLSIYFMTVDVVNKQMDPLSSSPAESDTSTWDRSWAESSLSVNPTADRHFYDGSEELDDASSVLTTSTMPMSEYQRRVLAADPQLNAKVPASILKKK